MNYITKTIKNCLLICVLCCLAHKMQAARYYVNTNGLSTNNGLSWLAPKNLVNALQVAVAGDEIWVAAGTYRRSALSVDIALSFAIPSGVKVYGGFAGNETLLTQRDHKKYTTTLTGKLNATTNVYHVVTFTNSAVTTELNGFVIEEGLGTGPNAADEVGAGIYISVTAAANTSTPKIRNCTLRNNKCNDSGAAVYTESEIALNQSLAALLFEDCVFEGNQSGSLGGALYLTSGCLQRCVIRNNTSKYDGGALYYKQTFSSHGTSRTNNTILIEYCKIENNRSLLGITGLYIDGNDKYFTMRNNLIVGNRAVDSTNTNVFFTLKTNLVTRLENNTIADNGYSKYLQLQQVGGIFAASGRVGGPSTLSDTLILTNNVMWNIAFAANFTLRTVIVASSNLIQDMQTNNPWSSLGTPNASVMFMRNKNINDINDNKYDYTLRYGSAGIDQGVNLSTASTTDIYGNPRLIGTKMDIGATERQPTYPSTNPTRIYVDAAVSAGDNTGSSWANAVNNLEEALRLPMIKEVWVKKGYYAANPRINLTIGRKDSFYFKIPNGVKMYGGFAGTETSPTQRKGFAVGSFLKQTNGICARYILFLKNQDSTTVIDGFTIAGLSGCVVGTKDAIGIIATNGKISNPILRNILFNNSNISAITVEAVQNGRATPLIENILLLEPDSYYGLLNNYSYSVQDTTLLGGYCAPTYRQIVITNPIHNTLYTVASIKNEARKGGVCKPLFEQSTLSGIYTFSVTNIATGSTSQCLPRFNNMVFSRLHHDTAIIQNKSYKNGKTFPRFEHCTFANNACLGAGAIHNRATNSANMRCVALNCIFWDTLGTGTSPYNANVEIKGTIQGLDSVRNCIVRNGYNGNVSLYPRFLWNYNLYAGSDYRLASTSPALNIGAPTTLTTDRNGTQRTQGTAPDIGAYEGVFATPLRNKVIPLDSLAPCTRIPLGFIQQMPNTIWREWGISLFGGPTYTVQKKYLSNDSIVIMQPFISTPNNPAPMTPYIHSIAMDKNMNVLWADREIDLTVMDALPTATITANTKLCGGQPVNITVGMTTYDPYTVRWSNGNTGNTTTVTTGGTYTATVTMTNGGCSKTLSYTLTAFPAMPNVTLTAPASACKGAAITLTTLPNASDYYYQSDFGNQPTSITTIPTNAATTITYTVRVTNVNGCSKSASTTITLNTPPTLTLTSNPSTTGTCGDPITLTAGSTNTTYRWSNGATTNNIVVGFQQSGVYTVTTTATNGCTASRSRQATVENQGFSIIGSRNSCDGYSLLEVRNTGVTPIYTLQWSTPLTTVGSVYYVPTGTYTVTVTTYGGCTTTQSVTVADAPNILPQIQGNAVICQGGNTTLAVNDTGLETYTWSTGVTTPTINVNTAAVYTVTATRTGGSCTGTASITVTNGGSAPTVYIHASRTNICDADTIRATAIGSPNLIYLWSKGIPNYTRGNTLIIEQSGTYYVTATNSAGCTATTSKTFNKVSWTNAGITPPNNSNFCTPSLACNIFPLGSNFTYNWSNNMGTTPAVSINSTGIYYCTVTDVPSTCTKVFVANYKKNPISLTAAIVPASITCKNATPTLKAMGTAINSASSFNYLWSNLSSSDTLTVTAPGTYTVTISDATCSLSTSYTVQNNNNPPTVSVNDAILSQINAPILLNATTNANPPTYLWSNGLGTNNSANVTRPGTYTLSVTDANTGCTNSDEANVTLSPTAMLIGISGNTGLCANATTTLTASGGVSYRWNTNATTATITVNQTGIYTVTVTNANGQTASSTVNIISKWIPLLSTAQSVDCSLLVTNVSVSAFANSYIWNTGSTAQTITSVQTGTFTVTATAVNGCTNSKTITVTTSPSSVCGQRPSVTNTENDSINTTNNVINAKIYPNPSDNQLNIVLEDTDKEQPLYRCIITDLLGRELMQFSIQNTLTEIDASAYPAACYIITLTNIHDKTHQRSFRWIKLK